VSENNEVLLSQAQEVVLHSCGSGFCAEFSLVSHLIGKLTLGGQLIEEQIENKFIKL